MQARGKDDVESVLRTFKEDGCEALDMTKNELAKDHMRHLAGGRSRVDDERIYRFEFPERQGALVNFLDSLNGGSGSTAAAPWNVSLFHYRNHGGDVGRVLAGMQVRWAMGGRGRGVLGGLGAPLRHKRFILIRPTIACVNFLKQNRVFLASRPSASCGASGWTPCVVRSEASMCEIRHRTEPRSRPIRARAQFANHATRHIGTPPSASFPRPCAGP